MSDQKSYDGEHVCVHVVQSGESYSKIATMYRLPQWQAIYLYNQKVRRVLLDDNPDRLDIGVQLFIPMRPEGYDKLIRHLQQLKIEMQGFGDIEQYKLEGMRDELKANEILIDFAGDAAKTLVSFGTHAYAAVRDARVARQAVGSSRIAAEYVSTKSAQKLSSWIDKTFKDTITEKMADGVDWAHKKLTGKPTTVGAGTHKTVIAARDSLEAIAGFSLKGGKFVLDVVEISDGVLEWLKPTKVANAILWLMMGETVDQAHENRKRMIESTVKRSTDQLDTKIAKYAEERSVVYPPEGSFIGRYMVFPPQHITGRRPVRGASPGSR